MMCYHRDESSTDGLSPGCLPREIDFDVMSKTEERAVDQEIPSTTCPGVVSFLLACFSLVMWFGGLGVWEGCCGGLYCL